MSTADDPTQENVEDRTEGTHHPTDVLAPHRDVGPQLTTIDADPLVGSVVDHLHPFETLLHENSSVQVEHEVGDAMFWQINSGLLQNENSSKGTHRPMQIAVCKIFRISGTMREQSGSK